MKKLLWIGDAVVATGFARVTHEVLDVVRETWEVNVLGINYYGDPHQLPFRVFPAGIGGDGFGLGRVGELCEALKPDLVVLQNDPWNVKAYMDKMPKGISVVGVVPVDGKNVSSAKDMNALSSVIFWTEFGLKEAREGGFTGPADVIPLGVDTKLYRELDPMESRAQVLGDAPVPPDAFIIGNVNRNQPRKRQDLTVKFFCRWIKEFGHKDAFLFLYTAGSGGFGYDVVQLMKYYGISGAEKRLILMEPHIGMGYAEHWMPHVYNCFDLQISTTQGEGWGLTTLEGMACGVPQLFPDWSALGEWAAGAGYAVPCSSTAVTPNYANAIGGVVDEGAFIQALEAIKTRSDLRRLMRESGKALASQPQYRWQEIGRRYEQHFATIVDSKEAVA